MGDVCVLYSILYRFPSLLSTCLNKAKNTQGAWTVCVGNSHGHCHSVFRLSIHPSHYCERATSGIPWKNFFAHLELRINWWHFCGQRSRSLWHRVRPILMNAISQECLERIYIWHKRPLGLKGELTRIWWWKVEVAVTSENTFLPITEEFIHQLWQNSQMSVMTFYAHKVKEQLHSDIIFCLPLELRKWSWVKFYFFYFLIGDVNDID